MGILVLPKMLDHAGRRGTPPVYYHRVGGEPSNLRGSVPPDGTQFRKEGRSTGRVDQHSLLIPCRWTSQPDEKKKRKRGEGWYGVNGLKKATNLSSWGDG